MGERGAWLASLKDHPATWSGPQDKIRVHVGYVVMMCLFPHKQRGVFFVAAYTFMGVLPTLERTAKPRQTGGVPNVGTFRAGEGTGFAVFLVGVFHFDKVLNFGSRQAVRDTATGLPRFRPEEG